MFSTGSINPTNGYERGRVMETSPSAAPQLRAFSFRCYPWASVFWMFWNTIQLIIVLLLQIQYWIVLSNDNFTFIHFWGWERSWIVHVGLLIWISMWDHSMRSYREERMPSHSQHLCTYKYSYKCPLERSFSGGGDNLFTKILHKAW